MMTRKLEVFTALTLLGSTLAALPSHAGYASSEEIAFTLRTQQGDGYLVSGNTVYVPLETAAQGLTLPMGMYIEADYADLAFLYAKIQSDSTQLLLNEETFHNPQTLYTDEKVEYTTSLGEVFSTRLKPYCLGKIENTGVYTHNSAGIMTNFETEENALILNWMLNANDYTAEFLGASSDEFSFIDLDVDLAPATPAGTYHVSFIEGTNQYGTPLTAIESNDFDEGGTYVTTIPTLKHAEVVVKGTKGDINLDGSVNAVDASLLLIYAANRAAGNEYYFTEEADRAEEAYRYYLADVDGESTALGADGSQANASDASNILRYAAESAANGSADWTEILTK